MLNAVTTRKQLLEFALTRASHEHAELSETWKALDTKAQATATIAGIFVAAAFVFVRNTNLQLAGYETLLLTLAVLFLVGSIALSVLAMEVRSVSMPLTGDEARKMVGEILQTAESEHTERLTNLFADTVTGWASVNDELRGAIECKGSRVLWAQGSLLLAAITMALLTAIAIYR